MTVKNRPYTIVPKGTTHLDEIGARLDNPQQLEAGRQVHLCFAVALAQVDLYMHQSEAEDTAKAIYQCWEWYARARGESVEMEHNRSTTSVNVSNESLVD